MDSSTTCSTGRASGRTFGSRTLRIYASSGHQFVTENKQRGRSRSMGIEAEAELAWLFTVHEGITQRWEMFSSTEQALAAAGLGPLG